MRMQLAAALHKTIKTASKALGLAKLPCLFNGRWIWLPLDGWPEIVLNYEPHIARAIDRELASGGGFVDVGAHVGLWSLYAAGLDGVTVVAVEPSPAFRLLEQATAGHSNIMLVNAGCGSTEGAMIFYAQGDNTIGTLTPEIAAAYDGFGDGPLMEETTVDVFRLDEIVASVGMSPSLVKIDVEGFEVEVLEGAQGLLAGVGTTWIIEVHPWQLDMAGSTEEDLFGILTQFGYAFEHLDEHNDDIYSIIAQKW